MDAFQQWKQVLYLVALSLTVPNRASAQPPRVVVETAEIREIGRISKDACTLRSPCGGLKRGSLLHLRLSRPGYALAFLQDGQGKYFNQEGRQVTLNNDEGSLRLWPGTDPKISQDIFQLWIVTSDMPIPTFPDSASLDSLPLASNGETWGPVYLSVGSSGLWSLVWNYIQENKQWIFSGVGVALLSAIAAGLRRRPREAASQRHVPPQTAGNQSAVFQAGRDIIVNQPQTAEVPTLNVRVHRAFFEGNQTEHFFLNVVNFSPNVDIEITHVWYQASRRVDILQPQRRLPHRLRPRESWETWIETAAIPSDPHVFRNFRVRTSTGETFGSEENRDIPPRGFVPGT